MSVVLGFAPAPLRLIATVALPCGFRTQETEVARVGLRTRTAESPRMCYRVGSAPRKQSRQKFPARNPAFRGVAQAGLHPPPDSCRFAFVPVTAILWLPQLKEPS